MSLATLVLALVLVGAGSIGLRRRRDWQFGLALVAGAAGAAISIAQFIATQTIWWLSIWDLLLAPATVAVAIGALPPALLLRLAPRTRRFVEFDRALHGVLVELGDVLADAPSRQDRAAEAWIPQAGGRGHDLLHRIERIEAPDPESGILLAAYTDLVRDTVAAIPSGATWDERQRLQAIGDDLAKRYEGLRRRWRMVAVIN